MQCRFFFEHGGGHIIAHRFQFRCEFVVGQRQDLRCQNGRVFRAVDRDGRRTVSTLDGEVLRVVVGCDRAGFADGELLDVNGVKALAAIPSKEVLVAKMLGSLQSSLYSFAYVLQAIIDKENGGSEEAAEA